jgi:general secretion pathway protein C
MQALSPERSSLALKAVVSLVTLAALALLGVVLAYWSWTWLAPRPEARVQPVAEPAGGAASARRLFGVLQLDRAGVTSTAIAVRLLGVVAATPGRVGYAVLQLEGRRIVATAEGEDVAPGIRLAEVHPDRIVLMRNGARESLAWPQKKAAASPAPRSDR